jgi:hypothetical protein
MAAQVKLNCSSLPDFTQNPTIQINTVAKLLQTEKLKATSSEKVKH